MKRKIAIKKGKKTSFLKPKKEKSSRRKISVNRKLDQVISLEKNLLSEEKKIERKEASLARQEKTIIRDDAQINREEHSELRALKDIKQEIEIKEKTEEDELDKLQKIEEDIKKEVGDHPLTRITARDVIKGLVGAFIGLAVHYTFTYGVEISEGLTFLRATLLFPLTFIIGLMFIYATGFRKVSDPKLLIFMPARLLVLYVAAIVMSILVLFLFYPNFGHEFVESYKMVAAVMLAAVVGACTADLFGKE